MRRYTQPTQQPVILWINKIYPWIKEVILWFFVVKNTKLLDNFLLFGITLLPIDLDLSELGVADGKIYSRR